MPNEKVLNFMANEKVFANLSAPPPDPSWSLEELRLYEKMTKVARYVCGSMGVSPREYFETLEAENITRRLQGLPPLP